MEKAKPEKKAILETNNMRINIVVLATCIFTTVWLCVIWTRQINQFVSIILSFLFFCFSFWFFFWFEYDYYIWVRLVAKDNNNNNEL